MKKLNNVAILGFLKNQVFELPENHMNSFTVFDQNIRPKVFIQYSILLVNAQL